MLQNSDSEQTNTDLLQVGGISERSNTEKLIYDLMLKYPDLNDREISERMTSKRVTSMTVNRYRHKLLIRLDVSLAQVLAANFLRDYSMAADAFRLQIRELREYLEKNEKIVIVKMKEDYEKVKVPLDPVEYINIQKQIADLWKSIIFLCRQGEAVEIMKAVRDNIMSMDAAIISHNESIKDSNDNSNYEKKDKTKILKVL